MEEKQVGFTFSDEVVVELQHNWMGTRLISSGAISPQDRDEIVEKQQQAWERGISVRFGELAVIEGYCSKEDINNLPGYIGDHMIAEGVISISQRDAILNWQEHFRAKGKEVRFGDLAVQEGFCSRQDIEGVIAKYHPLNAVEEAAEQQS